ncbi:hypothetical protein LTR86_007180 [Recurvomyces mirabilis]|nr:hypothetical protein LTR86_007180 [Recurvomyces mirabilis]
MALAADRAASAEHPDQVALKKVRDSTVSQAKTHSGLLQLPPELRLHIYEHCFGNETEITLSPDFRPPPLLSTCRIIRREALKPYYQRTRFLITITDCDARLFRKFTQHLNRLPVSGLSCWWALEGRSWENLLQWAHWVCEGENLALEPGGEDDVDAVVTAVLGMARHVKDWATCRLVLMEMRGAICALNAAWAAA